MLKPDQRYIVKWYVYAFLFGVAILLFCVFTSCSPYKKVAGNANPTEKEKSLLAVACAREFPVITNTYNIDSVIKATQKDYSKQIDSLTDLAEKLDSVIHEQIPIIDTAFVTDSNCISRIKIAYQEISRLTSKLAVISNLSSFQKDQIQSLRKSYEPCDSVLRSTKVITECDSARMQLLQDGFKGKSDSLLIMTTKYKDAKETSKNRLWIILVLAGLIGIGIFLKIKKFI